MAQDEPQAPCEAHTDAPVIDAIRASPGHWRSFADGATVFRQGERLDAVVLIEVGYLKFTHTNAEGVARTSGILNSGQLFGLALEGDRPAEHTAMSKGQSRLYRVPLAAYRDLLARRFDLVPRILEIIDRRQQWIEQRLHTTLSRDLRARVCATLYGLITRYGGRCGHGHEVDIPLTQGELAELAGASRPAVSTTLNALRRDGLVAYARDHICICDLAALRRIAEVSSG